MYVNEDGILMLNAEEGEEPERKGTLGKGSFEYTIIDEEGKLNINTASKKQLRHVFRYTGVEGTELDTIVDSIIDWRDTNNLHMLNGAEEDYYQSLERPYSCKDGPFDSIEELLLVKGMTPEIFHGSARAGDSGTGEEKKNYSGVARYLTVNGSGRININTAPAVVLEAVLGPEKADNILVQREAGPVSRPQTGGRISSDFFTVISTGSNADGTIRRTVKAILHRKQNDMEIVYWNDNITG
ncbi:MAG: general secretion pathway protein GspK [Deferribacteres bacterium]|nr:general secretion pathway protein GspK [Deferribacteres bacterium]